MQVFAIINPISGAGADTHAASQRTRLLEEAIARRGLSAEIHLTEYAGHAHALAQRAREAGVRLVLVWGGDGTVNEAGAALLDSGIPLGLVPAGSGNGLAAALRLPRDPVRAIADALDRPARAIDAGALNGRPFFNIAGIGVDARIAALFNVRARGTRGRWPYILIGMREGCRYAGQQYDVDLDGQRQSVRALLVAFANGVEYGNGVRLSAAARVDDGRLEAVVVEDRPLLRRFWDARRLLSGPADGARRVHAHPVRRALVTSAARMEYHVDGEPGVADGPVEVTVRPGALLIKG